MRDYQKEQMEYLYHRRKRVYPVECIVPHRLGLRPEKFQEHAPEIKFMKIPFDSCSIWMFENNEDRQVFSTWMEG